MNNLKTYNSPLNTLRNEADEDSSPLAITTESDFSLKRATSIKVNSDTKVSNVNAIQIQMCGGSADNKTFTWKLYGWRQGNGIATLMCDGTAVMGSMQVVKYPNSVGSTAALAAGATATSKFWADTIVISGNEFVKSFSVTDSGNNRAAILTGDLAGFNHLYLEISDADGSTGTEAGDVSAFYAGW